MAAVVGVVLLAALAVFQTALICGAPLGRFAWGGQHVVLPSRLRIGSAVSLVLYALFALLVLQAAGVVSLLPGGAGGHLARVLGPAFAGGDPQGRHRQRRQPRGVGTAGAHRRRRRQLG